MKRLLLTATALLAASAAHAAPVKWAVADGGNGHYYEVITTRMTLAEAEAAAAMKTVKGAVGHLATITSAAENSFIHALTDRRWAWIGAERIGTADAFEWTAGPEAGQVFYDPFAVPSAFSNFAAGEPNNSRGAEGGVHIWAGGTWNDLSVSKRIFAVVEYSNPAPVPLPASGLLLLGALGGLALRARKTR